MRERDILDIKKLTNKRLKLFGYFMENTHVNPWLFYEKSSFKNNRPLQHSNLV